MLHVVTGRSQTARSSRWARAEVNHLRAMRLALALIMWVGSLSASTPDPGRTWGLADRNPSPPATSVPAMRNAAPAPTPTVSPAPVRKMHPVEEAIWATVRALGPSAGSIVGGYAGTVIGPTLITSAIAGLGIATSGTGFAAAVIIPASPAIGKAVGSALGSALLSVQVNLLYEIRMQRFRGTRKTPGQIARDVARRAFTDGAVGAVSLGGGSAVAGALTEVTVKQMLTELVKKASLRLAGDVFMNAIGRRAQRRYGVPVTGSGAAAGEASVPATAAGAAGNGDAAGPPPPLPPAPLTGNDDDDGEPAGPDDDQGGQVAGNSTGGTDAAVPAEGAPSGQPGSDDRPDATARATSVTITDWTDHADHDDRPTTIGRHSGGPMPTSPDRAGDGAGEELAGTTTGPGGSREAPEPETEGVRMADPDERDAPSETAAAPSSIWGDRAAGAAADADGPDRGYHPVMARAAFVGLMSGLLGNAAGILPGDLAPGYAARAAIIRQFWVGPNAPDPRSIVPAR